MRETGNSFHAASSPCHTYTTVLAGDKWRTSVSANHDQMFSVGDISEDCAGQGSKSTPCVVTVKTRRATCDLTLSDGVWQACKIERDHWT